MRPAILAAICGLTLVVSSCSHDAEKVDSPRLGAAFPTLLVPPNGQLASQSGSIDALQLTFTTDVKPEMVAAYYRDQFAHVGWTIVGDVTDTAGVVSIHVNWDRTDQPMWVRIVPASSGSQVELAGAVPGRDSLYVQRSKAARDSSNTLAPR